MKYSKVPKRGGVPYLEEIRYLGTDNSESPPNSGKNFYSEKFPCTGNSDKNHHTYFVRISGLYCICFQFEVKQYDSLKLLNLLLCSVWINWDEGNARSIANELKNSGRKNDSPEQFWIFIGLRSYF